MRRTFYKIDCKTCDQSRVLITDLNESSLGYILEREKIKADFVLNHISVCRQNDQNRQNRMREYQC